jgi:hypothetical protein
MIAPMSRAQLDALVADAVEAALIRVGVAVDPADKESTHHGAES